MPRSFNFGRKLGVKGASVKDPRVIMRAIIGVLLAANLAVGVTRKIGDATRQPKDLIR